MESESLERPKRSVSMAQIITSQAQSINPSCYHSSVVGDLTTFKPTRLPLYRFRELKKEHHKACLKSISDFEYKPTTKFIYETIINNCDKEGSSRIAHSTIAKKLYISRSTVMRHCKRLEADGHIITYKNGWQESNTTVVIAIQHWNINKSVNSQHNHTPGEEPPKNGSSPPGNNEQKEVEDACPMGRVSPKEAEWDDHVAYKEPTEAEKAAVSERLKALKELHGLRHRKH